MIPKTIKHYQSVGGLHATLFDTGIVCSAFSIEHLDFEATNIHDLSSQIESFVDSLPSGYTIKFISKTDRDFSDFQSMGARSEAIADIGRTTHDLVLVVEKSAPQFRNQILSLFRSRLAPSYLDTFFENFLREINLEGIRSLGLEPVPVPAPIRFTKSYIKKGDGHLRIDQSYLSVLKLKSLGNFESSIASLAYIREAFPEPYEIVVGLKKIEEKEAQLLLNSKSKREESGNDLKSQKKYIQAQKAIEEIDNQGKKAFQVEVTILLWSFDPRGLHQAAEEVKNQLKPLGEFIVEDMGIFPSLISALPGGKLHVTNIELTDRVPSFLPIGVNGSCQAGECSSRSFLFHRRDDTIDSVDVFSEHQSNYSGIVIGRSGRGKSVFTNNLIQSLNNDPKLRIILVDVKGSHTNMVNNLGGQTFEINTSSSSAISPFNFLRYSQSLDIIEILADFMEKLLLEDNERGLRRSEQAILEECLVKYAQMRPKNPSIDDFSKRIDGIPRSDSLKRWLKGGVYGSIFGQYNEYAGSKIQYFDFTNIVTAQKGGISAAIMSAVMAHFNYVLLSKKNDEKLVFVADETPFFVNSCFSSFSLLMKNVRKLNGSLILIAQNLSDLVVEGDASLVSQTELRIFFSNESSREFVTHSGLADIDRERLTTFRTFNGKFAQFLILSEGRIREGRLRLSKKEYFRSTTLASDRERIGAVKDLFRLPDENTAIEILADIGGRYGL